VIPFVRDHNTILPANHGVVCWSDTVTHAEWLVEILDTYCRRWVIAGQIGRPLQPIPEEKLGEILELKRKGGTAGCPAEWCASTPASTRPAHAARRSRTADPGRACRDASQA
jgi:L-fuculose-phosphate aldolase